VPCKGLESRRGKTAGEKSTVLEGDDAIAVAVDDERAVLYPLDRAPSSRNSTQAAYCAAQASGGVGNASRAASSVS